MINQFIDRRLFTKSMLGAGALALMNGRSASAQNEVQFFKNLGAGHIGVTGNQEQLVDYAIEFGFGGVNPHLGDLQGMNQDERDALMNEMKENNIQWGAAGVPVQFRQSEDEFKQGLNNFPQQAELLESMGVTRMSTWILSGDNNLSYIDNWNQHKRRLREIALIAKDHGMRLGLEFVGPKTFREQFKFQFIYTLPEMLDLAEAIGTGNVGILLDSWHWHTSEGTVDQLYDLLNNNLVINVHVNDAPDYVHIHRLMDTERRLPVTTGVIDMDSFINFLADINYDGPVTCEPFDDELRALDNKAALQKTKAALDRVWSLIDSE